jgi:hypothetical protein
MALTRVFIRLLALFRVGGNGASSHGFPRHRDQFRLKQWKFPRGDIHSVESPHTVSLDRGVQTVVPHTWNAKDVVTDGEAYDQGIGWYRSSFTIPRGSAGRRIFAWFVPEQYQRLYHEKIWVTKKDRKDIRCKFVWNLSDFSWTTVRRGDRDFIKHKGPVTHNRQTRKGAYSYVPFCHGRTRIDVIARHGDKTYTDACGWTFTEPNTNPVLQETRP